MSAAIKRSWLMVIRHAIQQGDRDAAYRLTIGYLRRLREIGVLPTMGGPVDLTTTRTTRHRTVPDRELAHAIAAENHRLHALNCPICLAQEQVAKAARLVPERVPVPAFDGPDGKEPTGTTVERYGR
jgi:hypothetical protein